MDPWEFKTSATKIADFIIAYNRVGPNFNIIPNTPPLQIFNQLDTTVPEKGEHFDVIFKTFKDVIFPGLVHWNHPNFCGPYPSPNSYCCVLGDVLSAAIGNVGFAWKSCPILTELESKMVYWIGKLLNIPDVFLPKEEKDNKNGGSIQQTAENAFHNIVFVARFQTMDKWTKEEKFDKIRRFVVYASEHCGLNISRICDVENLMLHKIKANSLGIMGADKLDAAIKADIARGFIPLIVVCTIGAFTNFGVDEIVPISKVCKKYEKIWIHADCSYSTGALMLNRYSYMTKGLEKADSVVVSLNYWLNIAFDSSILYVQDIVEYTKTFRIQRPYLTTDIAEPIDLRNHGVALSRRFRALKIWFELRSSGRKEIEQSIRHQIFLAEQFAAQLRLRKNIFEIVSNNYCYVDFRIKGFSDKDNEAFYNELVNDGEYVIFPLLTVSKPKFVCLRFTVTSIMANMKDIEAAVNKFEDVFKRFNF